MFRKAHSKDDIRDCFTYFNVTSNSIIHWVN